MAETRSGDDFAALAEGHRRAGLTREAEQILQDGLRDRPDCAEGVLALALVLLEQERGEEARAILERWADASLNTEGAEDLRQGEVFSAGVSDRELERAFDDAEADPAEMLDADAVAQQAMREVDFDLSGQIASPSSSFATSTVAELLDQQGDAAGASRIRGMVDSSKDADRGASVAKIRDRRSSTIDQLERWLANVRGGAQ